MEFTLKIKCDNEAFGDAPFVEISQILGNLSSKMYMDTETEGKLFDHNGNTVGAYRLASA